MRPRPQQRAVGYLAQATGLQSTSIEPMPSPEPEPKAARSAIWRRRAVILDQRGRGIGGDHGQFASALGNLAQATGFGATSIGTSSDATRERSSALGHQAQATGVGATALGAQAAAEPSGATALAAGAQRHRHSRCRHRG